MMMTATATSAATASAASTISGLGSGLAVVGVVVVDQKEAIALKNSFYYLAQKKRATLSTSSIIL